MVMVQLSMPPEERSILQLLARGVSFKEIRLRMGVGENIFRHHLRFARVRLNANSTLHAVAIALDKGLISIRE